MRTGDRPVDRLIVGIDKKTGDEALQVFDAVANAGATYVKIGPVLMLRMGLATIGRELRDRGISQWFLDGKFCNTDDILADTATEASRHSPTMMNCMADVGPAALKRFADICRDQGIISLAVSVLTTKDDAMCAAQHNGRTAKDQVLFYANEWIAPAGLDGMVCSAQEASVLRASGYTGLLVTPGIRFAGNAVGDQRRVMTPADAIKAGSDYVVMATDILADPKARVQRFIAEVSAEANAHHPVII